MVIRLIDHIERKKGPPVLGESTEYFFEGHLLPSTSKTRKHAEKLSGLTVLEETLPARKGSLQWRIRFRFRQHVFAIDNDHAGCCYFFVSEPGCPDEILVEVLEHFHKLSPLMIDTSTRRGINWRFLLLLAVLTIGVLIYVIIGLEVND